MAQYETARVWAIHCPNPKCPDPKRVKKDGFHGGKQRYKCRSCGKKFMAEGKASYRQYTARQIATGIDDVLSGLSYKQAAEHMEDFHDVPEPSKHTIHDWVKGYGRLAQDFLQGRVGPDGRRATATGKPIQAKVGDRWVADEIFLRVGGQQMYCWNVMDRDSRYILAVHLSTKRDKNAATRVMQKALAAADRPPKSIVTDGLDSYVDAIKTVFGTGTRHVVAEGIHYEHNNNLSERLQGTIRQRTKTMRGMQARRTGQEHMDAWVIDYNFFKPHHTLKGKTPAQVAGMAQQVPWGDSWEGVTRMGGQIAEPEIVSEKTAPRKPGPKIEAVKDVVAEFLAQQKATSATTARKGKRVEPVASYPKKSQSKKSRGRGKKGMKPV